MVLDKKTPLNPLSLSSEKQNEQSTPDLAATTPSAFKDDEAAKEAEEQAKKDAEEQA